MTCAHHKSEGLIIADLFHAPIREQRVFHELLSATWLLTLGKMGNLFENSYLKILIFSQSCCAGLYSDYQSVHQWILSNVNQLLHVPVS